MNFDLWLNLLDYEHMSREQIAKAAWFAAIATKREECASLADKWGDARSIEYGGDAFKRFAAEIRQMPTQQETNVNDKTTELVANEMAVYLRDDYSREGCVAAVDVTRYGFGLRIYAPNGAQIETYVGAKTPNQIGRMLTEWCQGHAPRLHAAGD